jgi:dihydrofolate synthase/folylpolyglutamate synthase
MKLETFDDCEQALIEFVGNRSQNHSGAMTTERAEQMARFTGSPHASLKVVHIAGTSGKTSTSYFVSALLQASGAKVGLTVSPHIHSIAERALINGKTLDEDVYVQYFKEFYGLVKEAGFSLSYFEFMMVFSLWVFSKQNVDYAVIETGLGGLYDASNICQESNKVCVITDIGLDHTHILGDSLYEIAKQKAGIAWKGNYVVAYEQHTDVSRAICERMAEVGATWHRAEDITYDSMSVVPKFQQRNWQLAFAAYTLIESRDKLVKPSTEQIIATQKINVPARMESYTIRGKTVIIDGAHNEQKMTAFFDSFRLLHPGLKPPVLIALKNNKDFENIAPIIASNTDIAIATEFTMEQDMPAGAKPASEIAHNLQRAGVKMVIEEPDVTVALNALIDTESDIVLVIGSFFLAAEVSKLLKKKQLAES